MIVDDKPYRVTAVVQHDDGSESRFDMGRFATLDEGKAAAHDAAWSFATYALCRGPGATWVERRPIYPSHPLPPGHRSRYADNDDCGKD